MKKTLQLTDAQLKILILAVACYEMPIADSLADRPNNKSAIKKLDASDALGVYLLSILQRKS